MPREALEQPEHQSRFARTCFPDQDSQTVPLLDGVAKLVQRYLVGFSVVVGGIVSQLEGLVPKSVVLKIHNVRLY